MFAGTRPARMYGSHDGGRTWVQLALELPATTRITGIAVDPEDTETIYVGIEVGGLLRSVDGGRRWETINEGLTDPDVHALCVCASSPPTLHVATASDIFRSCDWGEHWEALRLKDDLALTYFRSLAVTPDNPDVLYVTAGVAPFGDEGALYRSVDMGATWTRFQGDVDSAEHSVDGHHESPPTPPSVRRHALRSTPGDLRWRAHLARVCHGV